MGTLADDLYEFIVSEIDNGDNEMEEEAYDAALTYYQRALEKVPDPKQDWEISLHIYTALGDVYYNMQDFENAIYSYNLALQCPEGTGNGYVWLGLGQAYFEMDETDKAEEALLSTYMLEGEELFEGDNSEYFRLIEDII